MFFRDVRTAVSCSSQGFPQSACVRTRRASAGNYSFYAPHAFRSCSILDDGGEEPISSSCSDHHLQQFALLLNHCGSAKSLPDGRLLHFLLTHHHLDRAALLSNRLLRIYAKCGACHDARTLFDSMHQRDSHSWRFVIRAYASSVHDSLQLFQQMMTEGLLPIKVTLISILAACTGMNSIAYGMRIHACVVGSEFVSDVDVGNTIINMYNRCQKLSLAVEFFDDMPSYNVVSFNTMMAALIQHEKGEEALELFRQMELQAVTPSGVTFISIVSACTAVARLAEGKEMHARVVCSEFAFDLVLVNSILNMYGKCGSLTDAERLFWEMPSREVATWNCMITSFIQHKRGDDALQLFQHMQFMGPGPNHVTFSNILSACASEEALAEVKRLHLWVVGAKSATDVVLGTALVNIYSKCGGLENARGVFANMSSWDAILWNAMIESHVKHGQNREAVELFEEMQAKGLIPTKVTFIVLLDAFTTLEEGKRIHAIISRHGFETDVVVATGLMSLYSKCCSLDDVYAVFDKMLQHDLVSWNALLAAIASHGSSKEALSRFQMMLFEGVIPDDISFICLCDACNSGAGSKEGLWIHTLIVASKVEKDVYVTNSIINMYGNCGNLECARRVFEESDERDEITWNAMISAYSQASQSIKALSMFRQMQTEGILRGRFTLINLLSGFVNVEAVMEGKRVHATTIGNLFEEDVVVANTLLNMYGKFGLLEDARTLFDGIAKQEVFSWSVMIAAYAQREEAKEAILIFQRMLLECVIPDRVTFISMLSACASQAAVAEGKKTHVRILENESRWDVNLTNALINMYGKNGSVEDASRVFESMRTCDVVSWNVIIAAYALHGHGKEALRLYYRMLQDGVVPNKPTYLIILSSCSHSGLLKEGLECFISMVQDHGIKPTEEHLNCIIDLLGRAGLLDEGEEIINSLLSQSSSLSWTTLLSFCKMHCDADRGERVARHALHLEPENSALYVLLSNIYASSKEQSMSMGTPVS
eukprot:c22646_g3_i1 orf=1066-4050(-)